VDELKAEMNEMVKGHLPVRRKYISYVESVDYFSKKSGEETLMLLENMNCNRISINNCGKYMAIYHGPMVPHTGLLSCWDLVLYKQGLLLRFPPSSSPLKLKEHDHPLPQLFDIYQEHKKWGKIRGIHCVGQLNALTMKKREIENFVNVSEALHMQKIGKIVADIHKNHSYTKLLLIAGPSSSGKTTFTKKLSLNLQTMGFSPLLVSLDDYYLPHSEVPLDEDGKIDLEALEALDVALLNQNLLDLFAGKEVEIPIFDFKAGGVRRKKGRSLRMQENTILLMEGIHGLNPKLTPQIENSLKYKIYISALTQLNLDDYNRIPTTDNRKIRRMVRDHQFRSYTALNTLKIFPSVIRGEKKNIFPYQGEANSMFNSALDYELAVLKIYAEPLLRSIKPTQKEYGEACRLLSFLSNISPIPPALVPKHSILREFIGDSGFHY
jgi:uridine kinase